MGMPQLCAPFRSFHWTSQGYPTSRPPFPLCRSKSFGMKLLHESANLIPVEMGHGTDLPVRESWLLSRPSPRKHAEYLKPGCIPIRSLPRFINHAAL